MQTAGVFFWVTIFLSDDGRGGVAEALSDLNKSTYEKRRNHFWIRRTKYALGTRPGAIFLLKKGIYFKKGRPEKKYQSGGLSGGLSGGSGKVQDELRKISV